MRLFVISFLCLASAAFGDTVIMSDMAVSSAATPTPTPLVNQGFEGTGYDNSETWTESGTVIDEDHATSPIVGSQDLEINSSAATVQTFVSFTAQDTTYGFCRFRWHTHSGTVGFIQIKNSTSTLGTIQILNASNDLRVSAQGGSTSDSSTGIPVDTNIYFWFEYVKGTGANSILRAGWSTDGTKPDLSVQGNTTCISSNGTSTSQANRLYLGTTGSQTMDVFYDHVLISTAVIGNNP